MATFLKFSNSKLQTEALVLRALTKVYTRDSKWDFENETFVSKLLHTESFVKMRLRGNETFAEFPGCLRERFESHLLKYSLYQEVSVALSPPSQAKSPQKEGGDSAVRWADLRFSERDGNFGAPQAQILGVLWGQKHCFQGWNTFENAIFFSPAASYSDVVPYFAGV